MGRNRWNHSYDHHNMVPGPAATAVDKITWNTEDGIMEFYGTGTPPTTANTYAEGCIYHKHNASSNDTLYVNNGTYASPSFELVLSTGNVITEIDGDHLATAADDTGPSPLIWDDAPVLETILDPGKGFHKFEDFLNSLTQAETGGTITQNTGSGTFTDDPTSAAGIMVLDNAANTNEHSTNLAYLAMQCKPGVGTHIYFEVRLKVAVDTGGVFIGLADDSTSDIGGSGTIVVNTDHAGFFRDNGTTSALMGSQACDGTNVTSEDDSIADVDIAEYENFGIHMFGDGNTAGDYVKFYHKGVLVNTITDADGGGDDGIPDAVICPTFNIDNLTDTVQQKLTIDWMRLLVYNATSGTVRA
ncbi:hypothetical protein LCGC14_2024360 [marine sediment metagenome]|uniref:Uncharacterized protein n=1 Tax=marine sediment metagenome TaxID=412755 RepID=A0A0F9EWK5_9ZZZZ